MHDLDVGRILWKEWRAQRSFWLALFALALGLEFFVIVVTPLWRGQVNPLDQLRLYQDLVLILACAFATGSAAIAFAGEVEAKTKGLLQRIPVRPRDLWVGKLSTSFIGSYVLLVVLWLAGGLMLIQTSATNFTQMSNKDISAELSLFTQFLVAPFLFGAIGGLFSLIMSDVLLTVLVAGASTAAVMAIPPVKNSLGLQAALAAIIAVCDFLLVKRWLRDTGAVEWSFVPRFAIPQLARRPFDHAAQQPRAAEAERSAVAWRRAASSLLWKEFRQAFPFCMKLFAIGLIVVALITVTKDLDPNGMGQIIAPLLIHLILVAPLLPGVAAIRAERKDGAFRLLANRGVTPDGFLICKQLIWLSSSLLVFGIILVIDQDLLSHAQRPLRSPSLWDFATAAAQETFGSAYGSVIPSLLVAAFHVLLLFELGLLLGLLLPGPIIAFFAGAIAWAALALCWTIVASLRIPFWWTVGLLPVIFAAVAWTRASDWLLGRTGLLRAGKAAATFLLPLVGMIAATIVFRITEIPAVEVPRSVLEPARTESASSPFAGALSALFGRPPVEAGDRDPKIQSDGWLAATDEQRGWVEKNTATLKLALEAAKRESGSLAPPAESETDDRTMQVVKLQQKWWLARLLLFSARKLEWENKLDEAFGCYVAVVRLTGRTETALDWMQVWAAQPKQTTERIKKAIREFESLQSNGPSLSSTVLREWRVDRRLVRNNIWGDAQIDVKNRTVSELWWCKWFLPWELVRLERLEDAVYAANLKEAEAIEGDLKNQGFVTMTAERAALWDRQNAAPWKYWNTTLAAPDYAPVSAYWASKQYVDRLATERMHLIALAIADFKREHRNSQVSLANSVALAAASYLLDHKKLPGSLQALVPVYFQRQPVDPWMGREFIYEPRGLPAPITFENGEVRPFASFLASAGMLDSHYVRRTNTANTIESRFSAAASVKRQVNGFYCPAPMVPLP